MGMHLKYWPTKDFSSYQPQKRVVPVVKTVITKGNNICCESYQKKHKYKMCKNVNFLNDAGRFTHYLPLGF